ncbi:DNA repair ATPase RecN [Devosia sp. UYZn731]|uniref:DUF6468 domain-containing protein n=1 Tax=Devosia sp. UYZn731 TaxID=3156345 RepID=UPI00339B0AAA
MMFGLPLGFFVESAVAVLMALTIGYCVVLNSRLKRLHADRSMLQQMVADLVGATNLANQAIKELKTTAMDADLALTARLEEAERFGIELANHVSAGSMLMERIAKITSIARSHPVAVEPALEETNKVQSALQQLNARARARENAA